MKIPQARPVFDEEMGGAALDALRCERLVLGRVFSGLRRSLPGIVALGLLFLRVLGPLLCSFLFSLWALSRGRVGSLLDFSCVLGIMGVRI